MRMPVFCVPVAALVLSLAACSSSHTASPASPAAPSTSIGGAVVDAFVIDSQVTAYEVSIAGALGICVPASTPGSCATATTDAQGNYTVNLGSYSGAVLLEATGGSYTDTVTGQTVSLPAGLTLSVLLPSVAPGSSTVTAQITALTTVAAQLAMQQAAQGTALATAVSNANSAVQGYFGALSDLTTTTMLNLNTASCGAQATQANYDVSLVLAGIAQLASQYGVTSAALEGAIIDDVVSDGTLDGLAAGTPISVPLASGSGNVLLTTIYGSSLAQSLLTAISGFEASAANACQATLSTTAQTRLTQSQSQQLANAQYSYEVTGTYTLTGDFLNTPQLTLQVVVPTACGDVGGPPTTDTGLAVAVQQPFTAAVFGTPINYAGAPTFDWNNCGGATWTLAVKNIPGQTCSVQTGSPPVTGTFSSITDSGDVSSAAEPTNLVVSCSVSVVSVGGTVQGLADGTALTLALTDATTSADSASTTVTGTSASSIGFSFSGGVQYGDSLTVAITSLTQPASGTQACQVNGSTSITAQGAVTVGVSCSSAGGGGGGGGTPAALNAPEGLAYYEGALYVANSNANQVLVLTEQLGGATGSTVTALTPAATITQDISDPVRLAFDDAGFLYVANHSTNTVSVYNTSNGNQEITASGGGALISGGNINGPLGVAVDADGNVYVANNATDSISIFQPVTRGVPSAGFTFLTTISADAIGNYFLAPGVIVDENLLGSDYLLVGTGSNFAPDQILVYQAPLTAASTPIYALSNASCSSGPSGPTAAALFVNSANPVLSAIYVASYYNDNVSQYPASDFIGSGDSCPTSTTDGNGVNGPEGLIVDPKGNVFVSNAGSSGTNANTITVYSGDWTSNNSAPVYIYPQP